MKQILWMIALLALVGCGKKPAEESVFEQGRPNVTKPSKPSAKTEAQIEAETKFFAETKAKAEEGDATGQYNLGLMYAKGEGVEQDFKEAFKWFQKTADQGNAAAQANLGRMYANGEGVLQDYETAYAWWDIAATNGNQNAKNNKSIIAGEMTPDQITKAEELVKEMVKKNPKLLK